MIYSKQLPFILLFYHRITYTEHLDFAAFSFAPKTAWNIYSMNSYRMLTSLCRIGESLYYITALKLITILIITKFCILL